MIHSWLGRDWAEVKLELERLGKPYTFQITRPHGKMIPLGRYRVVRVREWDDHVDAVLVYEKFSLQTAPTP